jgi:hypothetical protein
MLTPEQRSSKLANAVPIWWRTNRPPIAEANEYSLDINGPTDKLFKPSQRETSDSLISFSRPAM